MSAARTSEAASFSIARRDASSSVLRAASAFFISLGFFAFCCSKQFFLEHPRVALCLFKNSERLCLRPRLSSPFDLIDLPQSLIGLVCLGEPLFYPFPSFMEKIQERLIDDEAKNDEQEPKNSLPGSRGGANPRRVGKKVGTSLGKKKSVIYRTY